MADVKITSLAVLTAADPINDAIPIVDVSDNSMAASGTTKRISVNNILSSSPTATGAFSVTGLVTAGSATISGDLTVDTSTLKVDSTNNRVGIGTASPALPLEIYKASGDSKMRITSGSNTLTFGWDDPNGFYYTASTSLMAWQLSGSTAMTLNSTGLGVGVASPLGKLHIRQSGAGIQDVGYFENNQAAAADVGARVSLLGTGSVAMAAVESAWNGAASTDAYLSFRTRGSGAVNERLRIDSAGNLILQSSATPATLTVNGQLTVNATSNTNLRFSYRGSDGVTRVANITLA